MKKILFVCTGNTCRSPMAEAFMKAALKQDPGLSSEFCTSSAGVSAYAGDRASSHSIHVMMSEWKIDISDHSASIITSKAVNEAFLILTMEDCHKKFLFAKYPEAVEKTFTLKEYVSNGQMLENPNITDPYGKPLHIYIQCALEIKEAIYKLLEVIKKF